MKERFRSILLIVLVGLNFVLGGKILSDKKLWPSGYNFFITSENKLFQLLFSSGGADSTKTHLGAPTEIMVNTGDRTTRFSVNANAEAFDELFREISKILADSFRTEEKNIAKISKGEWNNVLNSKSVYFVYPAEYPAELLAGFLGVEYLQLPVRSVCRVAVAASAQNANVYLEDASDGALYRIETSQDAKLFQQTIAGISVPRDHPIINYSFDLQFDKAFGEQKIVLASSVPVYSSTVSVPSLSAYNPVAELAEEQLDQLLLAFRMNPGSVRQYTEANGTKVFVDNTGILKLSQKGKIAYQSTTLEGMSLTSVRTKAAQISAAADFADRITGICGAEPSLYLSALPEGDGVLAAFDYCAGGIPVVLGQEEGVHAVSVQLENGALKSYTQLARSYEPGDRVDAPGYIETLDQAIAAYAESMNEVEIQNISLIYRDDPEEHRIAPDWQVEVKSVIVDEE